MVTSAYFLSRPKSATERETDRLATDDVSISGLVLDIVHEHPIVGANIALLQYDVVLAREVSDSSGRFEFRAPVSGRAEARLKIERDHFLPIEVRAPRCKEARIYLVPAVLVRGRVVDAHGRGIVGADVWVHGGIDPESYARIALHLQTRSAAESPTFTDKDGRFSGWVACGDVVCEAAASGFAPGFSEPRVLGIDGIADFEIRLVVGHALRGEVVDGQGAPIAGAIVEAKSALRDELPDGLFTSFSGTRRTTTGDDGRFDVDGLTANCAELSVTHSAHATHKTSSLFSTVDSRRVVLDRAQWLTGRLVVPPPNKVELPVKAWLRYAVEYGSIAIHVEPNGIFRSDAFAHTWTNGTLCIDGFVPIAMNWQPRAGVNDLGVVTLDRGSTLRVRVSSTTGEPLGDASLTIDISQGCRLREPIRSHTDPSGEATLAGLAPGQHDLKISRADFAGRDEIITLLATDAETRLDVRLSPASRAQGRLARADGAPLRGARVATASRPTDALDPKPVVLASGEFIARDLPAGQPIELEAWATGTEICRAQLEPIRAGELCEFGTLVLETGIVLEGNVFDETGRVRAGVLVRAEPRFAFRTRFDTNAARRSFAAQSDENGRFRFSGLEADQYQLCAGFDPMPDNSRNIFPGSDKNSEAVSLIVESTVTFRGRVVDPQGQPIVGATVHNNHAQAPSLVSGSDGTFELHGVSRRRPSITVGHSDYKELRFPGTGTSAAEMPPTIELHPAASLEVALVHEDGSNYVSDPLRVSPSELSEALFRVGDQVSWGNSGPDEVFRLTELDAGAREIVAEVRGYSASRAETVTLELGHTRQVKLTLGPKHPPLHVRVLDPSGSAIVGARVKTTRLIRLPLELKTDSDGTRIFDHLDWENTEVTVRAEGFATRCFALGDLAPTTELLVRLAPESVIVVGTVLPDGAFVSPIRAELRDAEALRALEDSSPLRKQEVKESRWRSPFRGLTECDVGERIRFAGLSAGDYEITLNNGASDLGRVNVTLLEAETKEVNLEVNFPSKVYGQVRMDGQPVIGGGVTLSNRSQIYMHCDVDVYGFFTAVLYATREDEIHYSFHDLKRSFFIKGRRVIDRSADWIIAIQTGQIAGRVVDTNGIPIVGAKGFVYCGAGHALFKTESDGRFEIARLPVGSWGASLHAPWSVDHTVGDSQLRPGAKLEVVITAVPATK
ncbi:MAG: carboxypeptidase-like regulatory domain-containing protein [Planctomycetota bacterium]